MLFSRPRDVKRFLRRKNRDRMEIQVGDIELISCIYSGTKQKCKRVSSCRCPNGARWISKKWREDYTRRSILCTSSSRALGNRVIFHGNPWKGPPSTWNQPTTFPWVFFCNPRWSWIRVFQIRRVYMLEFKRRYLVQTFISFLIRRGLLRKITSCAL